MTDADRAALKAPMESLRELMNRCPKDRSRTTWHWDAMSALNDLDALIAAGLSEAPAPQEHPPIYADEAGDWTAANSGVGARIQMLERALGNCYMMSKREIARMLNRSPMDVGVKSDQLTMERWQHVKRFCEETGQKSSILRATLPTEITEG